MAKTAMVLSPAELVCATIAAGEKKAGLGWRKQVLLGILAGAFIAFASAASNMAAFHLLGQPETYGLGKCLAGAIFPVGLILVVVAGGELFTGNTLIGVAAAEGRVRLGALLRNWVFVYAGNFTGSVLIAHMTYASGLLACGAGELGGVTIKIASYKTSLDFIPAFYLGIMCNWLVCLAVWMAWAARDMTGKLFAVYFPIWLFITSGFEHCVANMYYVPAGIFAKADPLLAAASGLSPQALEGLGWGAFLANNLLPVTLGNIVGGLGFVGMAYWFAFREPARERAAETIQPTVFPAESKREPIRRFS